MTPWLEKAFERQQQAWAPGTLANYTSAVRKYLLFCYEMDLIPTAPRHQFICAYVEFLAKDTPSPRTISNHLSHIRTYLRKAGASTEQLDHFRLKWAMTAITRNKEYVPRIKVAFPIHDLHRMIVALPQSHHGNIITVAVLIMYYAALRQSEVVAPSASGFDHRKHLTRSDVVLQPDSVSITIKHAKNMQSIYQTKTVLLQASSNPALCIVRALHQMYAFTPTVSPHEPCIMFNTSRKPVTVDYIRRHWNHHITNHGLSSEALSLHSIRKAAATAAHDQGCPEIDIQRYGGWRSNAHRQYISTSQFHVNQAITEALSKSS